MKFDIKNIIIICLLVISIIFGLKWYFTGNDSSKDKIKELEKKLVELNIELKNSNDRIERSKIKSDSLENVTKSIREEARKQAILTKKAEADVALYKNELNKAKQNTESLKIKIKQLESNPTNRTGDDLIESLKNKVK